METYKLQEKYCFGFYKPLMNTSCMNVPDSLNQIQSLSKIQNNFLRFYSIKLKILYPKNYLNKCSLLKFNVYRLLISFFLLLDITPMSLDDFVSFKLCKLSRNSILFYSIIIDIV